MLKNLILDIGNVICEWDPDALVASAFDNPVDRHEAYAQTIGHNDWLQLDRGTLALPEAINRAQARNRQLDPDRIELLYKSSPASLLPIEPTIAAMHAAQRLGVPIYVLSNMAEFTWDYLRSTFDFWSICKGVVVSCDTGYIKPEVDIYHHLIDQFALQPEECVFVDDIAANTTAAESCGWQAVHLSDRTQGGKVINELTGRLKTS